jgi:hypothetical protein
MTAVHEVWVAITARELGDLYQRRARAVEARLARLQKRAADLHQNFAAYRESLESTANRLDAVSPPSPHAHHGHARHAGFDETLASHLDTEARACQDELDFCRFMAEHVGEGSYVVSADTVAALHGVGPRGSMLLPHFSS